MPDEIFEVYSVPSFDSKHPEYLSGSEIGSTKVLVQTNDVLLCKINPRINRVWVVGEPCEYTSIASSEWIIVRTNDVLPEYLAWYFRTSKFQKLMQSEVTGIGGSLTRAQPKRVAEYEVPICSIDEQMHIISCLNKVSQIVDERKQQLAELGNLIKARFVEMLGDPVRNPKGWSSVGLLELGSCKNGMNFHTDDAGVEVHCLGVGDFKDKSVISDTSVLPLVSLNEMPSGEYLLQDGDIVFVRSNGNKALVGRCLAVFPGQIQTTFSGFCIRFRKSSHEITTEFLIHVLKTESMRKKMQGRGANIQNLNQQILGSLSIPVPPVDLQNRFSEFVAQVDKSKLSVQKSLDQLETLKKALMQQYFE